MRNTSSVLSDVFFGTQQSKYAALAIFITISILCFFILFASSDISLEKRLFIILLIILTSVPSILFSLFELTCIVTGGTKSSRWWCYWLAWIISIIIIIYCLFIVISMFYSMASYDTAMSRIIETDNENKISNLEANNYAKNIMHEKNESDIQEHNEHIIHVEKPMSPRHNHITDPHNEPMTPPYNEPIMANHNEPMMAHHNEPMMAHHNEPTNMFNTMGYDASDNYASFDGENNSPPVMRKSNNINLHEATSGNVPEPYVNSKMEKLQDFSQINIKL